MPPKKKAKKLTDKDYREILLSRITEAENADIIGEMYNNNSSNNNGNTAQVKIDMNYKTGVIKCALISFYNGRGNILTVVTHKNDDINEFESNIGKIVHYGITRSMTVPADEINAESLPITIDNDNNIFFSDRCDEDDKASLKRIEKRASLKWVSCRVITNNSELVGAIVNPIANSIDNAILLTPLSGVTNDSWAVIPEENRRVTVQPIDDYNIIGKAIIQRSIFALNREEAKLHPDSKYHGERRKWADV